MKVLKSFALLAGLAFITAGVSAQSSTPPPPPPAQPPVGKMDPQAMAKRQTERIKQNVTGITPDQEKQILAANLEFSKSMQDAMASSNGDKDAMRTKMQPAKDARDAKLKTILTADQYTQYEKMGSMRRAGNPQGSN
jgi:hypothetical protein